MNALAPMTTRSPAELDARAEAARTAGDRVGLVQALAERAEACALSDPERARRDAVEARRLARTLTDPVLDTLASSLEVLVGWLEGRPPDLRLRPDDPSLPRPVRLRRALAAACLGGGPPDVTPSDQELAAAPTLAAVMHLLRAGLARSGAPSAPSPSAVVVAPQPEVGDDGVEALLAALSALSAVVARTAATAGDALEALLGPATGVVTLAPGSLGLGAGPDAPWALVAAGGRTLLTPRDRPEQVTVFLGPRRLPPERVVALLAAVGPLLAGRSPLASEGPRDVPVGPQAQTVTGEPGARDAWLRDGARLDAELRDGRLRFFPDVRAAFAGHLLTRDVLQAALEEALGRHAGVYAQVAADWGIEPYRKWMDFLRRNGVLLNFRAFRGAGRSGARGMA
jgi:hypothetical protein